MEYFYRPFLYKTWNGFKKIEKVKLEQIRKWQNIYWKSKEIELLLIFSTETIIFWSLKCRSSQIVVAIIFLLMQWKLSLVLRVENYSREETIWGNTAFFFTQLSKAKGHWFSQCQMEEPNHMIVKASNDFKPSLDVPRDVLGSW